MWMRRNVNAVVQYNKFEPDLAGQTVKVTHVDMLGYCTCTVLKTKEDIVIHSRALKEEDSDDENNGGARKTVKNGDYISKPVPAAVKANMFTGGRVRIDGLKSLASLNGKEGTLSKWDSQKNRWHVTIDGTGESKAILEANLTPVEDKEEKEEEKPPEDGSERGLKEGVIALIEGASSLAGERCTLVKFEPEMLRWQITLEESGDNIMLLPDSLTPQLDGLVPGGAVVIDGLKSLPALNGKRGTLEKWDTKALRWHVTVEGSDTTKALRSSNLTARALSPRRYGPTSADVQEMAGEDGAKEEEPEEKPPPKKRRSVLDYE
eukprot:TRINITY_DN5565_c0_g1_i1.p1 TRINITY_DN5565_c0_g1~~TRINITY_DN5565_c0_g1_i1.p1  ORF type:complete len:320 (-),score=57.24 TRINITY_DN5565_c0_g1_i1:173-1132(-)